MNRKQILTLIITLLILGSNICPVYSSTIPTFINVVMYGEYMNFEFSPISQNGVIYVPIKSIADKFNAKTEYNSKTKEVIITKNNNSIRFKLNSKDIYINNKLIKIKNNTKVYFGKTFVSLEFLDSTFEVHTTWDSILKTIYIQPKKDIEIKTEKSQDIVLPSFAYEYQINVLHNKTLSFWEWDKIDQEYLSNKTVIDKNKLIEEIEILNTYANGYKDKFIIINGMEYYPSNVSAIIDVLGRSVKNRYYLITNDTKKNIKTHTGLTSIFKYRINYFINKERLTLNTNSDKSMISSLKELPLDYNFLKGYKFYNLPHETITNTNEYEYIRPFGGAVPSEKQILFNGDSFVLYHEIGHIWASIFLKEDYNELYKMKSDIDTTNLTYPINEIFADEFAFAISNFDKEEVIVNSLNAERKKEIENMRNFIYNTQKTLDTSSLQEISVPFFNEQQLPWSIYTTRNKENFIKGNYNENLKLDIYDSNFVNTETTLVSKGNNTYKIKYDFDKSGIHKIIGFNTPITILSLTNQTNISNNNTWKEVTTNDVSPKINLWISLYSPVKGMWITTDDDSKKTYILITNGNITNNEKIDISDIVINNTITLNLKEGTKNHIIIELPYENKDKVVNVNGFKQEYQIETGNEKIIIENPEGSTFGYIVSGKVRTTTGKLYYEISDGNKIIYKQIIDLYSKYPHWDNFMDWINTLDTDSKNIEIKFYEDETKTIELKHLSSTI